MTTVINVKPAFSLNRYATLEEAVDKARLSGIEDLALVHGQILVKFQFDGSVLMFSYENGLTLNISIGNKKIEWSVTSDNNILESKAPENIKFELPSGNRFEWNWKGVLNSFVGKKMSIKPSDQLLFLHVHECGDYIVTAYSDVSSPGERFLDVSEE